MRRRQQESSMLTPEEEIKLKCHKIKKYRLKTKKCVVNESRPVKSNHSTRFFIDDIHTTNHTTPHHTHIHKHIHTHTNIYVIHICYIYYIIHIYIYIYIYIYTNLPVNVIVRLPHPRSGDSQRQKTFLQGCLTRRNDFS